MKTTMTRILTAALLLSLLSSCGAGKTDTADTGTATGSESASESTANGPVFPDVSYGGEAIHFLTEECTFGDAYTSIEIFSPGTDGSLINDTVYARNMQVEERFDVRITEERLQNASQTAYNIVLAGEDIYDVVMPYLNKSVPNATAGLYRNLYDVENLHLENSWWDQRANDNLQVGGKLYFTTGDISILDNECTMVLFFNKQLLADNDLGDPYAMVHDGKWTLDAMFAMCTGLSADLNGDGVQKNDDDRFGLFCAFNLPHSLYFGTGERIVTTDSAGELQLVMNNERSAGAVTKILENCLNTVHMTGDFNESVKAFTEGRLLMAGWALTDINSIRDCQFDFGILPYPKYNEEQEEYYSLISTILTPGVSIPVTNNEPEKAGLILEALAYYSVDSLTHAYYDTALNNRYVRDEDSGEMLDIIFASRVYDFGFIYDVGGMGMMIQNMFQTKKNNFASQYEALENKALAALDELSAAFAEAE
ncbi:MAG: hypothetical protein E7604_00190 [Ruminococcaceae bacterium]|nr:hypothetical protein [Oscillospiraceae bacterium]